MSLSISNVVMLVSIVLMVAFLCYAFLYSQERGIRYFAWVMVCRVVYAGSVIMEINSDSLSAKLLFRNIEQTSLLFVVPMVIFFVLALFGRDVRPLRMVQILAPFALWAVLIWTNPHHRLLFWRIELSDGHLEVSKTVYAIAFNVICYLLIAVCVFYLFVYLRRIRPELRKPGTWLVLCGCIPAATEIAKSAHLNFSPWLLPISVYCGFIGMAMLWLVIRYRMFSVVPLARQVVVETMEEGILIVNRRGSVVDSNAYVEPLLAAASSGNQPIAGQHIDRLLAPWPEWQRACQRMETGIMEIGAQVAGERRVYSVKVYPLAPRDRAGQGTVSVLFDITDKHRQMERIVQLNQLKDHLFAIVSHDIRNPLAVQASLIEVLEMDRSMFNRDHRQAIDALGGQIHHTFEMIENLLEWFRSQKEGMLLQPERLRLADEVEEVCRTLRIKSDTKHIAIRAEIDGGMEVYADREAVKLIVRNLLTNAIKFSDRGGTVRVRAERNGAQVIVSVSDNGVGIEEARIRELFDPHRLVSTTGTAGERGTGLGLQVCRQFVQMSGGQIWAESVPRQLTVFSFSLGAADMEGQR